MALSIARLLPSLSSRFPFAFTRHYYHSSLNLKPHPNPSTHSLTLLRSLSSSNPPAGPTSSPFINSPASLDWSDDDCSDKKMSSSQGTKPTPKPNLPPPYDPFNKNKNSAIQEPEDPSNLQEVFHKMPTEGLTNHGVKIFDLLSKDRLTHKALELFAPIKDKGAWPDEFAHTVALEAYANASGRSKDAVRTFEQMLASGVMPNAYKYSLLVKRLAGDGNVKEARKFMLEMMGKGMRPNAETYVAVFDAIIREKKVEEGRKLLEEMKGRGFEPDEKAVRKLVAMRGEMSRSIMSLLFGK